MKFKLVEYPYGRAIGFNQDIVWFIQGTCDNKIWNNYVWLYAFDQASKRFKKGKETAGIWTPIRHAVYPIWKRASNEELNKIYNDYKEKQKKSK